MYEKQEHYRQHRLQSAAVDSNGNVLESSKFPLLSAIASIVHSINSTSCEYERSFSDLSLTLGGTRNSLEAKKVEKMVFLRLNVKPCPRNREETKAVQAERAWEGTTIEIIGS